MDGELISIVPFEAVVAIQEIRTVPGELLRWVRLSYDQSEGWTREDLLSYSGDCGRFNLTVTSPTAAQAVEFTAYSGAGLYPIPDEKLPLCARLHRPPAQPSRDRLWR